MSIVSSVPAVVVKPYVEIRNGGYYVIGTRISLDSVVYGFQEGQPPESIIRSYPSLDLEQVYGAIAFYLANRSDIDAYLAAEEAAFDAMPQPLQTDDPEMYEELVAAVRNQKAQNGQH